MIWPFKKRERDERRSGDTHTGQNAFVDTGGPSGASWTWPFSWPNGSSDHSGDTGSSGYSGDSGGGGGGGD